nr:reverse transcriptase domain-containing protein [Tanacetum cinerariifolium]
MSENKDHHRQGRRFAVGGNGHDGRDPRDVEIERLRQRSRWAICPALTERHPYATCSRVDGPPVPLLSERRDLLYLSYD